VVLVRTTRHTLKVIPRFTNFSWEQTENEITIQDLYAALVGNQHRNELIVRDLQSALSAGRSPLVLTSRTDHLDYLAGQLHGVCSHVFILKGGLGAKQRTKLTESLAVVPADDPRVILATGSYLGEGFDDARLDTLLLAMPVSWRGTLQQYVGRLHRLHENKKEVQVYDYADVLVPMLARTYKNKVGRLCRAGLYPRRCIGCLSSPDAPRIAPSSWRNQDERLCILLSLGKIC